MNNGFFWVGHCQKVERNSVVDQLASRSRRNKVKQQQSSTLATRGR